RATSNGVEAIAVWQGCLATRTTATLRRRTERNSSGFAPHCPRVVGRQSAEFVHVDVNDTNGDDVMKKVLVVLCATAAFAIANAPSARAQFSTRPIDKSTLLTFSAPFRLPKVTLPAGTYLFKFADPVDAPGVLTVMSPNGETIYATVHTVPAAR